MKQIIEHLENITRLGYDLPAVFRDWLDLMLYANLRDDPKYLGVLTKYERHNDRKYGERPADYFANAYAELCMAWKNEFRDYLGEMYEEHVTRGEHGQFFTPEILCKMMAQMTCPDLKDGQSVSDCACGSARNLMAASRINRKAVFYGVDLDPRCATMATLNMLHMNLNAYIVCGDSLRVTVSHGYKLTQTPLGGTIQPLSEETCKRVIVPMHQAANDNHAPKGDQLVMF